MSEAQSFAEKVEQAIAQLRQTLEDYKSKRKRSLSDKDIQAITLLLTDYHRKDRF